MCFTQSQISFWFKTLEEYILLFLNLISDMAANHRGQTQTQVINSIEKNQNNALRIINFKGPWESSAPLCKESKFFKLKDIVTLNNLQFLYDQINKNLPKIISHLFCTQDGTTLAQCERNFPERTTLNVPQVKTITYVSDSVTFCAIRDWKIFKINLILNWH